MAANTALTVAALGALSAVSSSTAPCRTDDDCSLLGGRLLGTCDLGSGACRCDPPWHGSDCGTLDVGPTLATGAYGVSPNVTSWGGLLLKGVDGLHHLYVTEIMGKGCGLGAWSSHSSVTHAVAPNVRGPYVKKATALWTQAHNLQAFRFGEGWYIAHIGGATGNASELVPSSCNRTHCRRRSAARQQPVAGGIIPAASPGSRRSVDTCRPPACLQQPVAVSRGQRHPFHRLHLEDPPR